ncbi:MAG TPA: sigma-70 family RNA polymerase sigma factor [Candidatus Acidoferrales bacterium]|nr:sigma-70 family RNA polymerase sigma factor [Candidatus Acidoferrales bacterium]
MLDFHTLYERYAAQVRRFALFLSGDAALADDVTSETFVRAWAARDRIEHATVKGYLFTIARNLYHDSRRENRRFTDLTDSLVDSHASAYREVLAKAELSYVLAAMQQLPEIDRAALLMRAQREMSYEEISQSLGLSPIAVRVKIHRARQKLMRITRVRQNEDYKMGEQK